MAEWFLCLRYLRKRRIVLFPVAAVTLCVALLIVITSLFHGFVASYVSYTGTVFGELLLDPGTEISDAEKLASQIRALPNIAGATAVVRTGGLLYLGRGNVRAVQVVGLDAGGRHVDQGFHDGLVVHGHPTGQPISTDKPANAPQQPQHRDTSGIFDLSEKARAASRTWLEKKLRRKIDDTDLPAGVILGIGVIAEPDESTDLYDKSAIKEEISQRTTGLRITTARMSATGNDRAAATGEKRAGSYWLVDVVETGLHDADSRFVYLPFDAASKLAGTVGPDGRAHCNAMIQINLADGANVEAVTDSIQNAWRAFAGDHLGWSDGQIAMATIASQLDRGNARQFLNEIEKQLAIWQMMLGLICVVVVVLVFVVLFMVVMQKRRDVGVVRSLGASRTAVATVFLGYGAAIGIVGATLGLALGIVGTHNIAVIERCISRLLGFKVWHSGAYFFKQIPDTVSWSSVGWIMLAGLTSALLGALLPALRAARMQPADALRYE